LGALQDDAAVIVAAAKYLAKVVSGDAPRYVLNFAPRFPELHAEILRSQGDTCAICRSAEPKGRGYWHVDHEHATGRVRGILCNGCNSGLGLFHESIGSLRAAVRYLERWTKAIGARAAGRARFAG
jgi:hypothetical protein